MIIKSLKLKNYKKFEDREINFSEGLNIIKGLNEAGKSTISSALKTVLFTDVSSRSKILIEDKKTWGQKNAFEIELNFATKDQGYSLMKDFNSKKIELINLSDNTKNSDIDQINKLLFSSIGIETNEIFESVSIITQKQIAELNVSKDIKNAIQKSALIASRSDPQFVLAEYKKEYGAMAVGIRGMAKNPGILKYLQDQIEIEKKKYDEIKLKVDKLKTEKTTKKESGEELETTQQKIDILEKEFENQKVFDSTTKEIEEIEYDLQKFAMDIAEIERITMSKQQLDESLEFVSIFKPKTSEELDSDGSEISRLTGEIKGIMETLEEMQSKIKDSVEVAETTSGSNTKKLLIINAIVGLISLGVSFILKEWWVFLLMIPFSVASYFFTKNLKKEIKTTTNKASGLIDDFNAKQKNIEELQKQLIEKLTKYECESPDEFFAKKAQFVTLAEKSKEMETMLSVRLGDKSLEDIKKEQASLLSKKAEIETTQLTEEVKNARVRPEDYLRKRRELDMLKLEKRKLEDQFSTSRVRVEDSEYSIDDLNRSEERLQMLKSEFNKARFRYYSLELNIKALELAIGEILGSANTIVRDKIEEYLPLITGGRYEKVEVDENLGLKVFSNDKRDFIDPEYLSSGTIDQIYFLARIALLNLIDKDKLSPLILDDPFVTFDSVRLEATKKIINEIAKERQIIFFTCHDDYDEWVSASVDMTTI